MSDKKTLIMDAAIRLMAEDGISVPTAKIAKEAGVSNGTLFNYFETKQDLIDDVFLYVLEKMANGIIGDADFSSDLENAMLGVWRRFVDWARKNPLEDNVLNLLKSSQNIGVEILEKAHDFFASIHDAMDQAVEDKILLNVSTDLMCKIAAGHLDATVDYIREYDLNKADVEGLIRTSFDIYWRGISV